MRSLRHATTATLLGLAVTAAPSHAGDLADGSRVANAVYPQVPQRCGTVRIEYGRITPPNDTSPAIAEAPEYACQVRIKPGIVEACSDAPGLLTADPRVGPPRRPALPGNTADPYHSLDAPRR